MTATELSPAPTELAAPDYIARAREVAKVIEAEANNIEEAATITRPVYEALADAGLFWILIPGAYGGGGTDIVTAFKVIQEISRADGSTGWAFMANICSAAVAAGFMNSEGGQEMFGGEMYALFEELERIFDPLGIFNPGKKTGVSFEEMAARIDTAKR